MPRIVHLKITFYPSEEIRRHQVDLDAPPTLEQMRNMLLAHIHSASHRLSFIFKYCDDEGDYVTIGSEEEWHDALLYNQQRPMRIQIIDPISKSQAPKRQEAGPNQPTGLGESISALINQFIGGCPHFAQQWQQQQEPTQTASEEAASSPSQPPSSADDAAGSQQQRGDFNPANFEEFFRQAPQFQAMAKQFLQGLQASGCFSTSYPPSSTASSSCANPAASANDESRSQQQQGGPTAQTGFDEFFRQNPQFQPYAQMAMQFLQGLPASAASASASASSSANPQPNLEQLMRGLFRRAEPAQTREQQLATLHELGYLDDDANTVLLDRFHGNVERVVQEYVQFTSGQ